MNDVLLYRITAICSEKVAIEYEFRIVEDSESNTLGGKNDRN
jgi:hypothetical protein